MFTGIVEGTGVVERIEPAEKSIGLMVRSGELTRGVKIGESIAVNGCCLTATEIRGGEIRFDLLQETVARTNLKSLRIGSLINLERALPAQGRYGGHFVTGHIDATGVVRRWEQVGQDYELRIGVEPAQGAYLVPKGCIAIDGISLTVADVTRDEFSVWIIPHTRAVTALQERVKGDLVNLEFDLLAKYTEKILATRGFAATAPAPAAPVPVTEF